MGNIVKKILYNVGFIYLLTSLNGVVDINNHNEMIIFYTWVLIMFNVILFFLDNKLKRTITLTFLMLFPFFLSNVLTDLTGKEVLNFYNFYYTNKVILFQPYWLHMVISTLIIVFIRFGKKKSKGNRSVTNKYNKTNDVEIIDL